MENNNISESKVFFSYLTNPKIKFETFEPTERVILLVRMHPFTQIFWIINVFIFLLFVIIVNSVVMSYLSIVQMLFLNIFSVVFILSYIWFNFLNWYFNVGIITNKRVIDINFFNVLYKEITVARLDKIQDVTIKSGGYVEAFFDYGTIYVQTAGTEANVEFDDAPMPSKVVQIINNLLAKRHGPEPIY